MTGKGISVEVNFLSHSGNFYFYFVLGILMCENGVETREKSNLPEIKN